MPTHTATNNRPFGDPAPTNLHARLASGHHTAVVPRDDRPQACGTSRAIWPRGQALLAVAVHHGDDSVAVILMPRQCGLGERRLGLFRISDLKIARVTSPNRPPAATSGELRQVAEDRIASAEFQTRLEKEARGDAGEGDGNVFDFPTGKRLHKGNLAAVA